MRMGGTMKNKLLFLFLLFLVGCTSSKPLVVYDTIINNTCINNIVTIYNETEVIKYINVSGECPEYDECINSTKTIYVNKTDTTQLLYLIDRLENCEDRIDNWVGGNESDVVVDIQEKLWECEDDLEEIRDIMND